MNKDIIKTDRGWVDLSNLVYGKKSVNWNKSIGKTVDFQYDDIISTLTITEKSDNAQYVYVDVPGYVEHFKIYVGQIRHGQFGRVVKKITPDFKYNIGDTINDLLITDRRKVPGYKYYDYCCTKDGYKGSIREDHLSSGHGCPICNNSVGEKRVANYLTENNISFVQQYSFLDCKHNRLLHFDFYLPDFNACIEYDGIQHFEPIDFAGKGKEWADEQFKYTILRDKIKNTYCEENQIPLCRIKYTQNVIIVLSNFFNTLLTK